MLKLKCVGEQTLASNYNSSMFYFEMLWRRDVRTTNDNKRGEKVLGFVF